MSRVFYAALLLTLFGTSAAVAQNDGRGTRKFKLRDVRTYSGTDNNREDLGSVGSILLRKSYRDFPDTAGEEIYTDPNPRMISNEVVDQAGASIPSATGLSDAVWAWGQFIDHDLDLTDSHPSNGSINIPVLDPTDMLWPVISVNRSNHVVMDGVREPFNEITSFLDASQVYGSSESRALALRTMVDGKMKTSAGNRLPFNVDGLPNLGDGPELFVAGDIRCNENVVLTSLHTVFVREHNRLAGRIRQQAPRATDEQIYQLARKIVGAEIQIITYNEFLPAVMGGWAPRAQSRYKRRINPTIANEFSTALFRVGHTMLSSNLVLGETGDTLSLTDAFTNPEFLLEDPQHMDQLLLGLSRQRCQEIDAFIIDDVRNFLFLPEPFPLGLDLGAINIQRGRDHGLPPYNQIRAAYGLPKVRDFDDITSDEAVEQSLRSAYPTVDDIDPWVGGISEDHFWGANVGPLILVAMHDQFSRTRDGDRFFYTRDRDLKQPFVRKIIDLKKVTLGRVIRQNTGADTPNKMFFVRE